MKIAYKHLVKNIIGNPSIDEISDRLFQLGHEHEIEKISLIWNSPRIEVIASH